MSMDLRFTPKMRVLSDEQIREIHFATLEVLERVGVKIAHPEALEVLAGAGARVDGERVYFPPWVVEDAIRKAPHRVVLGNRDGERTVFLEGDKSFFGPSLDCIDYLDPASGERIRFTSEHCAATARVADFLPNFDWVMTIGMAADQPAEIADKVIARKVIENCNKPYVFCCNDLASEKAIHEMAVLACGGKENFEACPTVVQYSEPISPLVYYDPAVDKIIYSAREGVPLINFPAPQAAATAPATFAGTIVQGSAESLSGLVLAQAVRPGAKFIYGAFTTVMDMQTTIFSYGAAELSLMCGAMAQMAQHYRLPFFGTAGATDSKANDAQAGIEATFQCLSSAAIGSGLVHDCSSWMDHGSMVSPEFMVMVNEILSNVKSYMDGIVVNAETLAVDLIEKVGPGGNYLQERHTLQNFRRVNYSKLFDRSVLDTWKAQGSKTFQDRLNAMTQEALSHQPKPLSDEIIKEFDKMQASWM